ncbi:hypothetical protein [Paenibacillus roseipurpureus]|uniref:Uncharacterized protein n=1 Tax=Paenibacillus roseopurpureus TaxID=2918901 RepID=A0AA96LPE0_9BACL|nr:hypothetical protein [Paenibacillus sp. MBLB1832]WNR44862.1 hypothetical protein MJB10_01545 [Paenibacillus sp. MBLB1832]
MPCEFITRNLYFAWVLAGIVGFHSILLIQNTENFRIAFVSICLASALLLPAYRMIHRKSTSTLTNVLGWFYLTILCLLQPIQASFS